MSTADRKSRKADVRPVLGPAIERLASWKEIAVYLGREVRTVQRWERREGLPVHRHSHAKGSSVWAFKEEMDAWLHSRDRAASETVPQEECSESAADSLNARRGHLTQGFVP
jgi:phage terminase Nu1 subunit (DNA packaging protein)